MYYIYIYIYIRKINIGFQVVELATIKGQWSCHADTFCLFYVIRTTFILTPVICFFDLSNIIPHSLSSDMAVYPLARKSYASVQRCTTAYYEKWCFNIRNHGLSNKNIVENKLFPPNIYNWCPLTCQRAGSKCHTI